MYSKESIETLRNICDVKDILISIGGVPILDISEMGDEIRCPCPLHGGDNKTAFSWKKSLNKWTCFTKGCGSGTRKDIFSFISIKLNISFQAAVELLADRYKYTLSSVSDNIIPDNKIRETLLKNIRIHGIKNKYIVDNLKELVGFPGYYEDGLDKLLEYLKTRDYIYDDVKIFNFYPHMDNLGHLRLGIPVYDDQNRLVGINSRLMDTIIKYPKEITVNGKLYTVPKYKMTSFSKGSVLYNLNNAKQYSKTNGLIIVEGQLDVARLHAYGFYNAVCTMGTSLSLQQISLLYRYSYKVIFLVEEGCAARQGIAKSIKNIPSQQMKVGIAELPSGDADSNKKATIIDTLNNIVYLDTDIKKNKIIDYYETYGGC